MGILEGFCARQSETACKTTKKIKTFRVHIDHQGCQHARGVSRADMKAFLDSSTAATKKIAIDNSGVVSLLPEAERPDGFILLDKQQVNMNFIGADGLSRASALVVTEEYLG